MSAHVVFVYVVALIAFFAQAAKPVLAHESDHTNWLAKQRTSRPYRRSGKDVLEADGAGRITTKHPSSIDKHRSHMQKWRDSGMRRRQGTETTRLGGDQDT